MEQFRKLPNTPQSFYYYCGGGGGCLHCTAASTQSRSGFVSGLAASASGRHLRGGLDPGVCASEAPAQQVRVLSPSRRAHVLALRYCFTCKQHLGGKTGPNPVGVTSRGGPGSSAGEGPRDWGRNRPLEPRLPSPRADPKVSTFRIQPLLS